MSVLSHLALRFSAHPENVATEALAYILNSSRVASAALVRIVDAASRREIGPLKFETQFVASDDARPDLVGITASGTRPLIIEAKFWAGLTEAQPVRYLQVAHPEVLLFIVPEARQETIWRELERRVRSAGFEVEGNSAFSAAVGPSVLVLMSWRAVLTAMEAVLHGSGDMSTLSDVRQLRELCNRHDDSAFLPLHSEELTSQLARRIEQFGAICSDLTDLLVHDGLADVNKLRATGGNGYYGRYLLLRGHGGFLHFSAKSWAEWGESPIWLSLGWPKSPPPRDSLRKAGIEWFERDGKAFIPVRLPLGEERERVIASAASQLRAIANALPPVQYVGHMPNALEVA